jgi:phage gp36-like protein
MAYVTRAQIETAIPSAHLNDALDDDNDGTADPGVIEEIIASASQAVDAFLAGLFSVPFSGTAPAPVAEAAFVFTCERIYERRLQGSTEGNPFKARAEFWRKRLEDIGAGKLPLDAGQTRAFTPGAVVTDPAAVDGRSG